MFFDFAGFVRRYRLRKWNVARVSRRAAHLFVQHFVLGLTGRKNHDDVVGRTNTVRHRWASKLKELAERQLWFPVGRELDINSDDFNLQNFRLTFQRCLFCRPAYLYFHWKKEAVFRPCNQSHICPFCYARVAAAQYRDVKNKLRAIGKHKNDTKLVVSCRVLSRFVAAPDWDPNVGCDADKVADYERLLWGELQRERLAHGKIVKQLNRKTLGSMWRVCVIPEDRGWRIETRQLMLHAPRAKLPRLRIKDARSAYNKSVRVADCYDQTESDFFHILGAFNQYPESLLTGYAELVAAYLRAAYGMRMISGTGIFRMAGRRLIAQQKHKDQHATAKKRAAKFAPARAIRGVATPPAARRSTVVTTD